jgi:L-gulono-1,4-lactone dehydrogenase
MEWRNWSGSQRCAPARVVQARTRAEVAAAVAGGPGPVRVAGAGHSFSGGVPTDGTLLRLDELDRVLDADGQRVRVEAGIRLHALSRELLARGLAMPNLGDIDVQSLAGALCTGTHGTGARLPILSAQVESVELVLADGSERVLGGGDELLAARVSLGALGVVVAVTLRCVPAFRLRGVDAPQPLEDVLADLPARAAAHDHFEFWTFPHSRLALTRTNDRTDDPPRRPGRVRAYVSDVLLDNHAFYAVNRVARAFPRAIPRLNRFASWAASARERVDWSHAVFASPRLVRFEEMEYSIPAERAADAVRAVREILERHPVSFPIELRFVRSDDALLSPAHGRDSAYLAVHLFQGMAYEAPFREVEALLSGWGGRPHWGKRSFLDAAALAPRYPRWDDFAALRRSLDPDGRFANAWINRVLGRAA